MPESTEPIPSLTPVGAHGRTTRKTLVGNFRIIEVCIANEPFCGQKLGKPGCGAAAFAFA